MIVELNLAGMTASFADYAAQHFGCALVRFDQDGVAAFSCPTPEAAHQLTKVLSRAQRNRRERLAVRKVITNL